MESLQNIKQRFGIIGNYDGLNRALEKALRVSATEITVLVTGESGVGKENIPKIIYVYSENSANTFFKLIKKYNLDNIWMETNLMCMGEKASSALNDIKWKKIFLFNPGEEEFLLYKI